MKNTVDKSRRAGLYCDPKFSSSCGLEKEGIQEDWKGRNVSSKSRAGFYIRFYSDAELDTQIAERP